MSSAGSLGLCKRLAVQVLVAAGSGSFKREVRVSSPWLLSCHPWRGVEQPTLGVTLLDRMLCT